MWGSGCTPTTADVRRRSRASCPPLLGRCCERPADRRFLSLFEMVIRTAKQQGGHPKRPSASLLSSKERRRCCLLLPATSTAGAGSISLPITASFLNMKCVGALAHLMLSSLEMSLPGVIISLPFTHRTASLGDRSERTNAVILLCRRNELHRRITRNKITKSPRRASQLPARLEEQAVRLVFRPFLLMMISESTWWLVV